jgi:hypothetical protein
MPAKKRKHKTLEQRLEDTTIQQQKLKLLKGIRDMQAELKQLRKK